MQERSPTLYQIFTMTQAQESVLLRSAGSEEGSPAGFVTLHRIGHSNGI